MARHDELIYGMKWIKEGGKKTHHPCTVEFYFYCHKRLKSMGVEFFFPLLFNVNTSRPIRIFNKHKEISDVNSFS